MKENTDFYYDGIRSTDMGIVSCQVGNGLFSEPFLAEKQIKEITTKGREKPYFQGVKRAPLVFPLTLYFDEGFDEQKLRAVARWIDQDYYKPFYTTGNTERIWYCMLYNSSDLIHNGLEQGYITLTMRCNSSYTFSSFKITPIYDWSLSTTTFVETGKADFDLGTLDNLVSNADGTLTITETKSKWSDIPTPTLWSQV
jgi:phage-related protein